MSTESMPIDNLNEFTAAQHHPMAPNGYSPFPAIDKVGRQFQIFRQERDLTQKQVADGLEWSTSKVLRIENGQARPDIADARALLLLHGITDESITEPLVQAVRVNRRARTATAYSSILAPPRRRYLGYEAVAVGVGLYAPIGIPDILQTSNFGATLDAVMHSHRTEDQQELAARLRRERAAYLLGKFGPPLQVVICEGALRQPESAPDPSGEREQYAELRMIIRGLQALNTAGQQLPQASKLNPNISIQIASYSTGSYFESAHARSILHMNDQPHAAVYADSFEQHTSFDSALEGPNEQQHVFEELISALPSSKHTSGILDALLASLPA